MTGALTAWAIGRLTVRSVTRDRARQFGEFSANSLDLRTIERGAYLVVRQIAVGVLSPSARDAAVADEVARAARTADRPHRGHIPQDAPAVLFVDHAELVATLLLDIARGSAANHWWWRYVDVSIPQRVAEAIVYNAITAPAALDCLDSWGAGDEVMDAMTDAEAIAVADALWRTHVDPTIGRDPMPIHAEALVRSAPDDGVATPARVGNAKGAASEGRDRLAHVRSVIAGSRSLPKAVGSLGADVDAEVVALPHEPEPGRTAGGRLPSNRDAARRRPADVKTTVNGRTPEAAPSDAAHPGRADGKRRPDLPAASPTAPHPDNHIDPVSSADPSPLGRPRHAGSAPVGVADATQSPAQPTAPVPAADGFPTQLAGAFYLVGAMQAIEPSEPYPWGHERWALLAGVVLQLVEEAPDPIWPFLRGLAGDPDPADMFPPPSLVDQARAARDLINRSFEFETHQLATLVATPGVVSATRTHIDVQIPLERISMAARIRGLDADPGWCPELGHVIRFHFEDQR